MERTPKKGVNTVDEFLNKAQRWINLEEARASVAGTSQVPTQPVGAVTDVATTAQTVT